MMFYKLHKSIYLLIGFVLHYISEIMRKIRTILEDEIFYTGEDVQRRYEMIRAWRMYNISQEEAARMFGYGLPNFKRLWKRFQEAGILGLSNKKPGPKSRRETTEEVRERILELREQDMNIYEIADSITKEGTPISYGTVNRVLKEGGHSKKTMFI
jgi:transposase